MPAPKCSQLLHLRNHQSGGKKIQQQPAVPVYPRWPKALRAVRAWLAPIHWLTRYWQAFFDRPPPNMLVQLISTFKGGRSISLYFSTQQSSDSEKERDLSSLCSDVLKPLKPETKEKLKNAYAAEAIQDILKVCRSPDQAEAVKAMILKGLDAEAGHCLGLPPIEWKSKFVRKDATTFANEPSSNGQCGAVAVETLRRDAPDRNLWSYTVQRAYFDRAGDVCSGMPEKVTMKFSWKAESTSRANCKVLSFGRFR